MKNYYGMMAVFLVALMVCSVPAADIQAQEVKLSAGAGVGIAPDYEGSSNYDPIPLLFAKAAWRDGRYVLLRGNALKANLIPDSIWKAGPVVQYRPERDDVDNSAVDELRDVDTAIEVGAFLGVEIDNWRANAQLVQDIADGHDGFLFTIGGGYSMPINKMWRVTLDVSTTYADDDYMESYFEIDARDAARSGLDTFDADAGFKDVGVNLSARYNPWEHWSFLGLASYTRLIDDAEDSPVVDDEGNANQWFGGVIAIYRF